MRKFCVLSLVFLFVGGLAGLAMAGIAGTAHDLSDDSLGSTELCKFCHTPHNSMASVTDAPLWNHTVTTQTFTVYSNAATLDASDLGQPGGVSKLCLSCHDGTVALGAFQGGTDTTMISGSALIGIDLSNDHPVSFTYDAALATADGGLHNPTTTSSGLGAEIDDDMLFSDKVECASCHDVHDNTNAPFLRKANTTSALCLTCHDK